MDRETTGLTDKLGLRLAVSFSRMSTLATFSACVPGVDKLHRNASELCLVDYKTTEFVESPFAESLALLFPNCCPEALEVFKYDASLGVLCNLNDFLRNGVIGSTLESSLSTGEFFEMTLCRTRTFLLKGFLKSVYFYSDIIHGFSGKGNSIRCGGKVYDSEINSKFPFWIERSALGKLNAKAEIKNAFNIQKIGLAPDSSLVKFGIGSKNNRYFESSVNAQNRNGVKALEGKYALIVNNGRMLFENVKAFLFGSVRFRHFANGADSQLSGQPVFFTNKRIAKMVQAYLSKLLFFAGYSRNIVARLVENFHRFNKRVFLFFGWKQLYFNGQLHRHIVPNVQYKINLKRRASIPLPPKGGGLLDANL